MRPKGIGILSNTSILQFGKFFNKASAAYIPDGPEPTIAKDTPMFKIVPVKKPPQVPFVILAGLGVELFFGSQNKDIVIKFLEGQERFYYDYFS